MVECNYSSMPLLQRRFWKNSVELRAWVSDCIPQKTMHVITSPSPNLIETDFGPESHTNSNARRSDSAVTHGKILSIPEWRAWSQQHSWKSSVWNKTCEVQFPKYHAILILRHQVGCNRRTTYGTQTKSATWFSFFVRRSTYRSSGIPTSLNYAKLCVELK